MSRRRLPFPLRLLPLSQLLLRSRHAQRRLRRLHRSLVLPLPLLQLESLLHPLQPPRLARLPRLSSLAPHRQLFVSNPPLPLFQMSTRKKKR